MSEETKAASERAAQPPTARATPPTGSGSAAAPPTAPRAEAKHGAPAAPVGPTDPPPPAELTPPAFITALLEALPGAVEQLSYWVGDWTVIVPPPRLLEVARFLRDAPAARFDYCSDVTATDWPLRPKRFDVIYCLYSTHHRHRVRIKTRAAEDEPVPSVVGVWPAANWLEREVYDMFGVNLVGHPDRRRILMPEEWQGHPLRKDYPLEGPGEFLMENPQDWLRVRLARDEAAID